MKKELMISGVILVLGGLLLFFSTSGFTAFTMEAQRLQDLKAQPPEFPNIEVVDNKGREYNFDEFEGKHMLMTFIYTSCATACPEMSRSEEHTSELQSRGQLVCRLLLEQNKSRRTRRAY